MLTTKREASVKDYSGLIFFSSHSDYISNESNWSYIYISEIGATWDIELIHVRLNC